MTARRYAEGTKVPAEKSKAELERLLRKHGARQFGQGWDEDDGRAVVFCTLGGRSLRFEVWYPEGEGRRAEAEWRRLWRVRVFVTKAKLELIASGESTVEHEFLADVVMPDGRTVGEAMSPVLEAAYETGQMPKLLPGSTS